jgi:hypothetical protein
MSAANRQTLHTRNRPSVDRVVDLLAGLDESQVDDLLRDMNHTGSSNVPVSHGIDFFSKPAEPTTPLAPAPTRRRTTYLSSISTVNLRSTALRQEHAAGHRVSSAPTFSPRPKSAGHDAHGDNDSEASHRGDQDRFCTPRSYKRISRPLLSLPTPDVHDLLAAYLSAGSPSSTTTSSLSSWPSSPATPLSAARFAPLEPLDFDTPGLDLLEPSPTRAPYSVAFGSAAKRSPVEPAGQEAAMCGIFEVLAHS